MLWSKCILCIARLIFEFFITMKFGNEFAILIIIFWHQLSCPINPIFNHTCYAVWTFKAFLAAYSTCLIHIPFYKFICISSKKTTANHQYHPRHAETLYIEIICLTPQEHFQFHWNHQKISLQNPNWKRLTIFQFMTFWWNIKT